MRRVNRTSRQKKCKILLLFLLFREIYTANVLFDCIYLSICSKSMGSGTRLQISMGSAEPMEPMLTQKLNIAPLHHPNATLDLLQLLFGLCSLHTFMIRFLLLLYQRKSFKGLSKNSGISFGNILSPKMLA